MPRRGHGTYQDDRGYLRISAGPLRGQRVHVLVAEAKLGRKLKRSEVVHHANGDKLDCRPENLIVLSERDHNAVSAKQYWFLKKMDLLEKKMWDSYHSEVEKLRESAEGDVAFP
jgi:hypothetical protein